MKEGVIVCGHGSRSEKAKELFAGMVSRLSVRYPENEFEYAFLEFQTPNFREAVASLKAKLVTHIHIVPAFLFTGVHLQIDIPYAFRTLAEENSEIAFAMGRFMGVGDKLVNGLEGIIHTLEFKYAPVSKAETSLLIVGVGASVPDANTDIAQLAIMLGGSLGYANTQHAFISKMAKPYIDEGLEKLVNISPKRIIVVPILLFPGMYLNQIQNEVEWMQSNYKGEILITDTLGDSQQLLDILSQRLDEVRSGKVNVLNETPDNLRQRREFD